MPKMQMWCQDEKVKLFFGCVKEARKAGMDVRDYGLIQLPSRIKRGSRNVPVISILDE